METATETKKFIRVSDVAKSLSLSVTHTYELISRGVIPSVRLGNTIRVPADELAQQLARLQRGSVPPTA